MKTIALQSLRTLLMNIVQIGFGLLSSVILARALGPQGRGDVALAVLLATTVAMVCNPGIYASANYFLSTGRWTRDQAFGTVALSSGLIGAGAGAAALLAGRLAGLSGATLPMLSALAVATLISNSLNGLFYGARKISTITSWKMLYSLLQCVAFGALVPFGADANDFLTAFTALAVLDVAVLLTLFGRRERLPLRTDIARVRELFGYGVPVYGSRLLLFAGQRLDTYMVAFYAGTAALGHYTIAVTLAEQIWVLPLSISAIMMPNLGQLALHEAAGLTASVTRLAAALVLLASIGLSVAMTWLIPAMYGPAFAPAVLPFLLLLPGTAAVSLFTIVEPFFQSRGRPRIPLAITSVGVLANFAANLALIPRGGMVGAALASSLAYALQLAAMCYAFARLTGLPLRDLVGLDRGFADLFGYLRNSLPTFRGVRAKPGERQL